MAFIVPSKLSLALALPLGFLSLVMAGGIPGEPFNFTFESGGAVTDDGAERTRTESTEFPRNFRERGTSSSTPTAMPSGMRRSATCGWTSLPASDRSPGPIALSS
jgi:hypothetical protein